MSRHFDYIIENLTCGIYVLLIFVSILQVFFRYVLNYSLSWTEEIGRYSFVWLTFVGAAICVRTDSHIGLDIVTKRLSKRNQFAFRTLVEIGTLAFLLFLMYEGGLIARKTFTQVSAALHVPMGVFYLSIPVGALLMFINTLRNLFQNLGSHRHLHKSD